MRRIVNVEARITKVWKKRMILLIAFVFAAGMWFYYDGFIGWPAEAKRYTIYQQFVDDLVAGKIPGKQPLTRAEADAPHNKALEEAWREHARANGLGTSIPSDRTEADFQQQKWIGSGAVGVSLLMVGWYFLSCARVLRADDDYIISPEGKKTRIDSIVRVNKKKWDNKGIAILEYDDGGKTGKVVLDDYKYGGAEEILLEVERRLAARSAG